MRAPLALALLLPLAACGDPPEAPGEEGSEAASAVPVDTTLAVVLADLHLADARAETTGEPRDSLRALAFAHHGLDSVTVAARVAESSQQPEDLFALYGAVQDLLSRRTSYP